MIIGDPGHFAIECAASRYFVRKSFLAIGFFNIHLDGGCFGQRYYESTMLACSFGNVSERILRRGRHTAFFADYPNPIDICKAFYESTYADIDRNTPYFGVPAYMISAITQGGGRVKWAPDGDAAFDDGSFVMHFDIDSDVRLIGFKTCEPCNVDEATVKDVRLPADEFYGILTRWRDAFQAEWDAADKEP